MVTATEPRVLVVEDEPAQREVLIYNLAAEGFDVDTASSGDVALTCDDIVLDAGTHRSAAQAGP